MLRTRLAFSIAVGFGVAPSSRTPSKRSEADIISFLVTEKLVVPDVAILNPLNKVYLFKERYIRSPITNDMQAPERSNKIIVIA
jgi:hypothetical protein